MRTKWRKGFRLKGFLWKANWITSNKSEGVCLVLWLSIHYHFMKISRSRHPVVLFVLLKWEERKERVIMHNKTLVMTRKIYIHADCTLIKRQDCSDDTSKNFSSFWENVWVNLQDDSYDHKNHIKNHERRTKEKVKGDAYAILCVLRKVNSYEYFSCRKSSLIPWG